MFFPSFYFDIMYIMYTIRFRRRIFRLRSERWLADHGLEKKVLEDKKKNGIIFNPISRRLFYGL